MNKDDSNIAIPEIMNRNDLNTTIHELADEIDKFSRKINWDSVENPKNLAMALSVETAEVVKIFQWLDMEKAQNIKSDSKQFINLQVKIAEVFWQLIRICTTLNIDLTSTISDKIAINEILFPIDNDWI